MCPQLAAMLNIPDTLIKVFVVVVVVVVVGAQMSSGVDLQGVTPRSVQQN